MAIQKLRDGTEGALGKILIGVVVVIFGFFGFGSFSSFNSSGPKVASVNGSDIPLAEFEHELELSRRALMARGASSVDIDDVLLRQTTLTRLVDREVFSQRSAEWNMQFSDAMIDEQILQTAAFQRDGRFDADYFKNSLSSAGYSVESYRDELRTDKIYQQFVTGIADSSFLTEVEAERIRELLSQKREVAYLELDLASLTASVEMQETELEQFFAENRQNFVNEETVRIEYLELKIDDFPSQSDFDVSEVEQFFVENRANYQREERRNLSHIFLEFSTEKDQQEVQDLASKIHYRLLEGEDFASLAQEYSEDLGSKADGGLLGFNAKGTFDSDFERAAFALPRTQFSSPIEVATGIHIVKVNDIEASVDPILEDVLTQVEGDLREFKAEEEFYLASNRLSELLFETPNLEIPAKEFGISVKRTEALARSSKHPLFMNAQVVESAFSPDVLMDGNNSDLIEIEDGYMIGLRVSEHTPAYQKDLNEVSTEVSELVMQQKSRALSKKKATDIIEEIERGSLAQYVADKYGYSWTRLGLISPSQQGVDPQVLSAAFKIPRPVDKAESLGTAILSDGSSAVIRISSVESDQENSAKDFSDDIKSIFGRQRGFDEMRYMQESLRDSLEVDLSS